MEDSDERESLRRLVLRLEEMLNSAEHAVRAIGVSLARARNDLAEERMRSAQLRQENEFLYGKVNKLTDIAQSWRELASERTESPATRVTVEEPSNMKGISWETRADGEHVPLGESAEHDSAID